jgi:putative transposase
MSKRRKEKLTYAQLSKHIVCLKKTSRYAWLADIPSTVLTQSIIDLDKAFNNFFAKRGKYPRFKKKSNTQHIRFQLDQRNIHNTYSAGNKLKLPILGELDVNWPRIPKGTPKMVTITKTASNKYFVSFSCEEEVNFKPRTKREAGTDVGIKDIIVTSDNYRSGAPKYFNKYAYQLKLAQRALKRKTKGSKRYNEQLIKIARIYEKMANCRKDFIHKETTRLIEQYDVIYLEDLNVAGMLKNRKLSKAVADVGMYEIRRQLEYKAHWYGNAAINIKAAGRVVRGAANKLEAVQT